MGDIVKFSGYAFIALGVAFIVAGIYLFATAGSPVNIVTIIAGAFITFNGFVVLDNVRQIEKWSK
jgi:uncharacterized BrkB/YihY/UPF0761 family membrane protein